MAGEQQATQPAPDAKAILRGEHVLLRALRRDNADRFEEILREPEVARWWGGHDADARRIVEEIFEDPGAVSYAIQAQGELVGLIHEIRDRSRVPPGSRRRADRFRSFHFQGGERRAPAPLTNP